MLRGDLLRNMDGVSTALGLSDLCAYAIVPQLRGGAVLGNLYPTARAGEVAVPRPAAVLLAGLVGCLQPADREHRVFKTCHSDQCPSSERQHPTATTGNTAKIHFRTKYDNPPFFFGSTHAGADSTYQNESRHHHSSPTLHLKSNLQPVKLNCKPQNQAIDNCLRATLGLGFGSTAALHCSRWHKLEWYT